ncbi:hypothetical protein COOONC_14440 [Cooperia oncophora]
MFFTFQSAGHAKWEKADILEMTVDYLKKLRALRGHTPTFNVAATLEDTLSTHGVKECDSTPTSAVSSPSSTESTSEGPTAAKRRKTAAVPSPSNTEESRSLAPAPSSPTPSSLTTLTPTRIPPTVMAPNLRPPPPNFSFMAQHLLALQYQQNLKMAAIAPGMVSAITPVHPFAAMTAIPWRTM